MKIAVALTLVTAGTGLFLVMRQVSPRPRPAVEPPPLEALAPEPEPDAPREPIAPPSLAPPAPARVASPTAPAAEAPREASATESVAKIPRDRLELTLQTETDPERKLALIERLRNEGGPVAHYTVSVLLPDSDKRVRLAALRAVEAMDRNNDVLMDKVHTVYRYESDPEVHAELDRLLLKYRPLEEAEARRREAATQANNP